MFQFGSSSLSIEPKVVLNTPAPMRMTSFDSVLAIVPHLSFLRTSVTNCHTLSLILCLYLLLYYAIHTCENTYESYDTFLSGICDHTYNNLPYISSINH